MSSIKNIVILILLLLNGILLLMTGSQTSQARSYQQSALTNIVQALDASGTKLDPEILPQQVLLPSYTVAWEGPNQTLRDGLEALLGPCTWEQGAADRFQGRHGSGELDSSGGILVSLEAGALLLDGQTLEEHGASCLEQLGLVGDLIGREEDEGETTLRYQQIWQGRPVFSCTLALRYEEGALREINGKWAAGTQIQAEMAGSITMPTVLTRFLEGIKDSGNVCGAITAVTAGYYATGANPMQLHPVWEIEADGQSLYYVDAVDGTFRQPG